MFNIFGGKYPAISQWPIQTSFFFWLSSIATPTHLSFSCGVKEKKCTV